MNLEREYKSPRVRDMFGGIMLIDKKITTKWNSKTKIYYESLGYQYTKMGDVFDIYVFDLKKSSKEKIKLQCDYCGSVYLISNSDRKNNNNIDCCKFCKHLKAKETIKKKYNVSNIMDINGIKEKRDTTIKKKYGVSNVFQSKEIKEKIKNTNFEKYGSESFTKTELYNIKRKNTSLKKYGEESHMKTKKYKDMFSGENNPTWKGGVNDPRWERLQPLYRKWRTEIFSKDGYKCKKCLKNSKYLEAHHIFNWNDNPEKRYEKDNGITFCRKCHSFFHKKYGKKNNDLNQLIEYLNET